MTHKELCPEDFGFSTVINTSKEIIPATDYPIDLTLGTYLDGLSCEAFDLSHEETGIKAPPSDPRRRMLECVLEKLLTLEIDGKDHIEEYVRYQYRCYFQPNTIRSSFGALVPFVQFIKDKGKGSIEKVEKKDLEAFVEHEQDRALKLTTVRTRLAALKAFLRFMIDKGVLGEEVFPWKLKIKMPETLPRVMDPDDVDRLLSVEANVRGRAMILLLLRTGMRIGELLSTRVTDVDMEKQKILIYEGVKNLRGRVVYFSDDAKDALKAWLKKRNRGVELLFYGYKGKALSYVAARIMFMKYLDKAGLFHKGYTLHCLCHTYATELLNARMPLECLEKLMGHSRLEVTRRYARLMDKTKEEEYFKAMAVIERREKDGHSRCDRELQALLEKTQLLCPHSKELHEHP